MRRLALALALITVTAAAPLAAQTPPAHAPYTLATPILTLMEDPRTLAFLDKHFPGLSERMRDPEVAAHFGDSSIEDLSKDPDHGAAQLTPDVMEKLAKSLAAHQAAPAKPAT